MTIQTGLRMALVTGVAALALSACETMHDGHYGDAAKAAVEAAVDYDAVAMAALATEGRFEADGARDEARHPGKTIAFFQVAPGDTVFEVEAGGGYFTELNSYVVGENGAVIAQNPEGILPFIQDTLDARFTVGRLANVRQSISNFDALDAEDGSADVVTWVQGPHELYYVPDNGEGLGDIDATYAEIFRITAPGGVFGVIDHAAAAGAAPEVFSELHRVDPAVVIGLAEAAGFVLEAEAAFLGNGDDDMTKLVFDPAVRGKTSQFVLRFRKPAN